MLPVQYMARILEVPLQQDNTLRAVSGLVPVKPVETVTERDQPPSRSTFQSLAVGQTLTGLVKSLNKGIALVEIDGQTVAMRLPHEVAPGDTLRLRFAGHMPQAVFQLVSPEPHAGDAPQLSQTARMLSELMQQLPGRGAPPTVTPHGPLLEQATTNPAIVAVALRTALVRSGLFYESHLANWAIGQDTLDGLMQEPQNRLPAVEVTRATMEATVPAAQAAAAPVPTHAGEAEAGKTLNPLHAVLSQQLQVLESPQFVWRGDVWPGQSLEWQLRQETDPERGQASSGDVDAGRSWESRLQLTLPQLGALTVHIRLDAQQAFSIRVVPEQPGVEGLLRQNRQQLAEQLATAGCTLHTLAVQRDDPA